MAQLAVLSALAAAFLSFPDGQSFEIEQKVFTVVPSSSTTYPILDPRFWYAADRHMGESRVGSVGTVNKSPMSLAEFWPACTGSGNDTGCGLRFKYAFGDPSDPEEFVGIFFSLGRIGISTVNPDGTPGPTIDLHMDSLFNLTDLMLNDTDDGISIEALRMVLRPDGSDQTLTLRVELEDQNRQKMFKRVPFDSSGSDPVTLNLSLSDFIGSIDLTAVKLVIITIEELHKADQVTNPPEGGYDVEFLGFVDEDGPRLEADSVVNLSDREMVTELARRDFESLLRLVDTKTGASLDRTLFRDLLHWGATGWLLASLPAAVEQGWITDDKARELGLKILRFVDDDALWGDDPVGKIGNSRGVIYRFGGIDPTGLFGPLTGTRKLDVGDINAVEASVIDTALFEFGAATFAAGFSTTDPRDQEIQDHARSILNRTRWNELVEPNSGQLYLAWKPERDDTPPGFFTVPAGFGGFWASRDAEGLEPPLTIDFWTDEGAMAAILAAGSEEHSTGPDPWYSMIRTFGKSTCENVVVTYFGSWFTYTFLTATYLDPALGPDRGEEWGTISVDWIQNTVDVFNAFRLLSPPSELILSDAVELPDITYLAQGLPDCAVNPAAKFTGTRTSYSLQLAIGLGGQAAESAVAEIRRILIERPEVWDPMFGLLDSFHPNLTDFLAAFSESQELLRTEGRWVQQQVWPLNKGGALLAQLNYLDDGIVWRAANKHNVIRRGVNLIYGECPTAIALREDPSKETKLDLLRQFRDQVLEASFEGEQYVQLFYAHWVEVSWLLLRYPELLSQSRVLIDRFLPVAQSLLAGKQAVVSQADLKEAKALLRALATYGSPELQADIQAVQADLWKRGVLEQFGIVVW